MAEKIESKLTGQLCEALLTLKKKSEMQNFLEDICTISEYQSLAQRFEVARMLHFTRITASQNAFIEK